MAFEEFEARRCLSSLGFMPHEFESAVSGASSIRSVDLDRDGDLDLVISDEAESLGMRI